MYQLSEEQLKALDESIMAAVKWALGGLSSFGGRYSLILWRTPNSDPTYPTVDRDQHKMFKSLPTLFWSTWWSGRWKNSFEKKSKKESRDRPYFVPM